MENQWEYRDIPTIWKDTRRVGKFLIFNKIDGKFYLIPKERIDRDIILLPPRIDTGNYTFLQVMVPVQYNKDLANAPVIDYFERYEDDGGCSDEIKINVHRDIGAWLNVKDEGGES